MSPLCKLQVVIYFPFACSHQLQYVEYSQLQSPPTNTITWDHAIVLMYPQHLTHSHLVLETIVHWTSISTTLSQPFFTPQQTHKNVSPADALDIFLNFTICCNQNLYHIRNIQQGC